MNYFCGVALAMNWGSVPDWGAAIGTVGAVIFTLRVASSAERQRQADERRHLQASGRAIIINIVDILNDLMSIRKSFQGSLGSIHVLRADGAVQSIEFYKPGLGISSLKEIEPLERHFDLLEKDPATSSSYRLAIRRHRAHIAVIADYSVAIGEMRELRELIRSEQSMVGAVVEGRQENLRLRAENVKSIGDELFISIAEDIVDTANLADRMRDLIKPMFEADSYPHIDTERLRKDLTFPGNSQ